jgi:hypothetical protein
VSSLPTSEKAFGQAVCDLARLAGWVVYRTFDSRRSPGGFPDLVLCRRSELLFRELKGEGGHLTEAQREWLAAVAWAATDAGVWTPQDWLAIEETLR